MRRFLRLLWEKNGIEAVNYYLLQSGEAALVESNRRKWFAGIHRTAPALLSPTPQKNNGAKKKILNRLAKKSSKRASLL